MSAPESPGSIPTASQSEPRPLAQTWTSDELFRLLVQSVGEYAIFMLDPQGRIMTWNEGAQRIKGYRPEEIIGRHFSVFYPPEDAQRKVPDRGLKIAEREGRWQGEGWRVRKDGSHFWANVLITAVRAADGRLVGFAKVTRDLTERRIAEEERSRLLVLEHEARQSAEQALDQLRAVHRLTEAALTHVTLDSLLDALLDLVREILEIEVAVILLAEQASLDDEPSLVLHAARGLAKGRRARVQMPLNKGFAGRVAATRRPIVIDNVPQSAPEEMTPELEGLEAILGVPLIVQGQLIGVLEGGSHHARSFTEIDAGFLQIVADRVALAIDHARLVEAEQSARKETEVAEAMLQARDAFLSVAAHELKTPITTLRIGTQMLLRRLEQAPEVDRRLLERSLRAVDAQSVKLTRLIVQLLERVRLQSGRQELEIEPMDLAVLVRQAAAEAEQLATNHEIVVDAPQSMIVSADSLRLEQVITNLLDNAIKFSPDGGRILVELTHRPDGEVQLVVQDAGIGVDPGRRRQLFQRFYQAHRDEHRSGMGLGLYISREIMTMHGGTIEAQFPDSGGTRVVAVLPAGPVQPD